MSKPLSVQELDIVFWTTDVLLFSFVFTSKNSDQMFGFYC